MAGALTKASRLKPEIRLAQAVSQFEADLSEEQKIDFCAHRSQSLKSPPDLSDVMRITAQIDRQVSGKVGSRCFGPRFTNFLQAAQNFAALGDVVIGGSQNIIACGVWSLVRMSLLSYGSFASYIDKLSALFMDIGRSTPRYQAMALLYHRSKSLQSHLFEYFIAVVKLCHRLFKFAQKSTLRQMASALSDADIKNFQTEFNRWANSIKDEVGLLTAANIESEAQENSRFRALSSKYIEFRSYQQNLATKQRVLDFCSTYDYETTWKQTRKIGNTTLFTQLAEYPEWKDCSYSCTLLCTGKLGSGKSVLLANVVDDLNVHAGKDKIPVTYFFCRHDVAESLKAQTILGSLARQLLCTIPDLAMLAEGWQETCSTGNFDQAVTLLCRAFPPSQKAYFILDRLDECDRSERETLAQGFQKIQKTLKFLLLISSRVEPDNSLESITERFGVSRIASMPDDNPEIEAFIDAELERCLQTKELVIGDPTLILDIQNALLKGSQGMFLWASLQIQSLCAMRTDQAIQEALADLPKDLSETFARILHKSQGSDQTVQTLILKLITVARRPLTTDELREALSVTPGDATWMSSRLLNDARSALACCGCLLTVDEEESTIRFVHHSVKQFLLSSIEESRNVTFTVEMAHRAMADIIVTYLYYGVFGTEVSTKKIPQMKITSTPTRIIQSTMGSSSGTHNLALKLLRSRKQPNSDITKTLAEAINLSSLRQLEDFWFYPYAQSFASQHIFYLSSQEPTVYSLFATLMDKRELFPKIKLEDIWEPLVWATENGNERVVKLLVETGKVDDILTDQCGLSLLSWATGFHKGMVVKLLLETGKTHLDCYWSEQRLLLWAVQQGNEMILKLLIERGNVDVDMQDEESGQTPLYLAAMEGQEAIVKLLLKTGKANFLLRDWFNNEPLSAATVFEHEAIIRLLLETSRENLDADDLGQMLLSSAVANGHEAVVRSLLTTGKVQIDSEDIEGWTPLSRAAQNGHDRIVKLLLETGKVQINAEDINGRTPLSRAARHGHEGVVKLLLETGKAQINLKDLWNRTPLLRAAEKGHKGVVKLLLETGKVQIDLEDELGRTPLSYAAENGREGIVKLLLETGKVQINVKDIWNRTPLLHAAEKGHKGVVKLLLKTGKVQINAEDIMGWTPLSYAVENGHEGIAKLLLENGKV